MVDRFVPRSLEELASALAAGTLSEGHHVDFKRELAAVAKSNKDLAKDIAAFANDGGMIVIGVDEGDRSVQPVVAPVQLRGLRERVDQIARSNLEPPLSVRCAELFDESDPAAGALVVSVPASADAPHMVDGRFWGRSDTTGYQLPQVEVDALYARRYRQRVEVEQLLGIEIARDPTTPELRQFGHLFFVAQPDVHDDERFLRALGADRFSTWATKSLVVGLRPGKWAPDLPGASQFSPRAGGWGMHDWCISPERGVRPNGEHPPRENHLIDLEVLENGGIRLFSGRATDEREQQQVLVDVVLTGTVLRGLETAAAVAATTGYGGSWSVGLAVTNLRGVVSYAATQNLMGSATGYSADTYQRVSTVQAEDLEHPAEALRWLVGPLLHGVGSPFDPASVLSP